MVARDGEKRRFFEHPPLTPDYETRTGCTIWVKQDKINRAAFSSPDDVGKTS